MVQTQTSEVEGLERVRAKFDETSKLLGDALQSIKQFRTAAERTEESNKAMDRLATGMGQAAEALLANRTVLEKTTEAILRADASKYGEKLDANTRHIEEVLSVSKSRFSEMMGLLERADIAPLGAAIGREAESQEAWRESVRDRQRELDGALAKLLDSQRAQTETITALMEVQAKQIGKQSELVDARLNGLLGIVEKSHGQLSQVAATFTSELAGVDARASDRARSVSRRVNMLLLMSVVSIALAVTAVVMRIR